MSSVYLSPMSTMLQLLSDAGIVTQGYLLWTYQAGTSTPVATYTDNTGVTPNSNPIQLNSAGRLTSEIWQTGGTAVKFIFSTNIGTPAVPVFGVQVGQVYDNIQGINDVAYNTTSGQLTMDLTGMTGTIPVTVNWTLTGKWVSLRSVGTGTSNANTMTMTGLPSTLAPTFGATTSACLLESLGTVVGGWATITPGSTGIIIFGTGFDNNESGFSATGTKGLPAGFAIGYNIL